MNFGKILLVNIKHNFIYHLILALIIILLIPKIVGITALDYISSMKVTEMFLVFIGAVLLTPIFLPEQDKGIRDTVYSKKVSFIAVYFIRVLISCIALFIMVTAFVSVMKYNECDVNFTHIISGFTSALFLGSLGLFVSGLTGNTVLGSMSCMIYYVFNVSLGKKLGIFNLFSMYMGGSISGKFILILLSALIISIGFMIVRERK